MDFDIKKGRVLSTHHSGRLTPCGNEILGHLIEHKNSVSDTGVFISLYAHTNPRSDIVVGVIVKEGDIIATFGYTRNSKSQIIPHLHFSLGQPSDSFSYEGFVWNTIRRPEMITLLDPLAVIDWPYQALDSEDAACCKL